MPTARMSEAFRLLIAASVETGRGIHETAFAFVDESSVSLIEPTFTPSQVSSSGAAVRVGDFGRVSAAGGALEHADQWLSTVHGQLPEDR